MWSRSKSIDRSLAAALDSFAGQIRSGASVRSGLSTWHTFASDGLKPALLRLRDLLALGLSPTAAFDTGCAMDGTLAELGRLLVPLLKLHEHNGGDLAGAIHGVAMWLHERSDDLEEARAAAAGAKLSGRVVAALPLAFLPLAPLGRAPMFDPTGALIIVVGVGLAIVGMRWIGSLIPSPPEQHDSLDRFARAAALLLRGGMTLRPAFDAAAASAGKPFVDLSCRVALGSPWSAALQQSPDPFLRALGAITERAERLGLPVAKALEELADQRRQATARTFTARLRRAPVLMMVPLALCVLPSFGLLALGPFLRGLVSG